VSPLNSAMPSACHTLVGCSAHDETTNATRHAYAEHAFGSVAQCATGYTRIVIKSFEHKGLRMLFEKGSHAGVQPHHAKRLRLQLAALDTAHEVEDMDIPGFGLHSLKGTMANRWSVTVSGNWRMTFEFRDGNAYVLDYEDDH